MDQFELRRKVFALAEDREAVRDAFAFFFAKDESIINGSRIFTSVADKCQYTLLVTRSDTDLPKHKGIALFLVPIDDAAVQRRPDRLAADLEASICPPGPMGRVKGSACSPRAAPSWLIS